MLPLKCILFFIYLVNLSFCEDVCYKKDKCRSNEPSFRYLFYEVNPSEGFNLRRDVYMRMAVFAHTLSRLKNPALNKFLLVLPPWSHLVHWSYSEKPEYIPWSKFFDLQSLKKFAPVMELNEYFNYAKENKYTKLMIDNVYILQHFEDMFESGNFEERWKFQQCLKLPKLRFFYYTNITTNNVQCLSFHGPATKLQEVFTQTDARTILLEHAEVALHDTFGDKVYWQARRSMRFNTKLRDIANEFRETYLNSTDGNDNIVLASDWRFDQPSRNAHGGPYISIHLRRRDFLRGRADEVPNLDSVAEQISQKLNELQLNKVFIATDASQKEYDELQSKLLPKYEVYKYKAPKDIEKEYLEGGIAIIDQIISSHARYFIGTSESTFSFRIQEEREVLGFPTETTFNVLCKDTNNCKKSSMWKIVY